MYILGEFYLYEVDPQLDGLNLKVIDNYCDFFINSIVKHEEENMNEWKFSNHELLPEASELLYS